MSRYSEKLERRRQEAERPTEPVDAYSAIPDASLRRYFRARAGMYGMTRMLHRSLKIEVGKENFGKMLCRRGVEVKLEITSENAEALGELFREQRRESQRVDVWSQAYGGRMKAVVCGLTEETLPTPAAQLPVLAVSLRPKPQDRPVTRTWRREGTFVAATAGIVT